MLFKSPEIGLQWAHAHPETRTAVTFIDSQIKAWGLPQITLTDVVRTPDEQERIYLPTFLARGFSETEARQEARAKFSWHLCECAVDFRSSGAPYSEPDSKRIWDFMSESFKSPMWELLFHDVGLGKHFHVGYRDYGARRNYEKGPANA
jgi:hypothetical protein